MVVERSRGVAVLPIALIVLVKPFYALFFMSFGLLLWTHARERRALPIAAVRTLALTGLEVLRWGDELKGEALAYVADANASSWLTLPLEEQTPMSIWN